MRCGILVDCLYTVQELFLESGSLFLNSELKLSLVGAVGAIVGAVGATVGAVGAVVKLKFSLKLIKFNEV